MRMVIALLLAFFQFSSFALVNIGDKIESQNIFKDSYQAVFGQEVYARKESFKKVISELEKKQQKRVLSAIRDLDSLIPEKILTPLVYWRYIEKNPANVEKVLEYFFYYKLYVVRDLIDNPLSTETKKLHYQQKLQDLVGFSVNLGSFYQDTRDFVDASIDAIVTMKSDETFLEAIKTNQFILKLAKSSDINYSLSSLGFIPGNQVEIISQNDRSLKRIEWLNKRVIFAGGELDFTKPYMQMPSEQNPDGHIIFKEDPIYKRIREMIDRAHDSVFIDIFLFGGTFGGTLSKYLLDQAILKKEVNPNFRVMILHDYATNYNMNDEMLPVFEYIKNRIEDDQNLKDSVFLLQANIQRHPPGIPFGLTSFIPKTPEVFKVMEQKSTYFESKIDHSKVIVIDGNTDLAEAYFGSKNWTDHSGGYYYDDAIWVKGPAASLVQASYYDDIDAALTIDEKEQAWFYYKELGFSNERYLNKREQILEMFKISKTHFKEQGDQKIRIAEANVDGTIKNVRNILVDMILHAKKNIYMEQLFLYDKYIVDALIKRKIQYPELDIKVLIDHNGNFGMNGLPNTIFLKELKKYGIQVRARKLLGVHARFPDGSEKEYHQENHRKATSIDGKVFLGGSSNINPDTLQGSFREFGAQVFDQKQIARFDQDFLADWENPEKAINLDIENFRAKISGKELSKGFSAFINSFASFLIRNKDFLEKRF